MNHRRALIPAVLAAAAIAGGCTANLRISMGPGSSTEPEYTRGDVEVFTRGAPARPYARIGRISVPFDAGSGSDTALAELERRALAADADALIDVVTARDRVSGTMIRYVTR